MLLDMPIRKDRRHPAPSAIAAPGLQALLVQAAVSIAQPNLISADAEARR
ncbi:MAG TPA: hypothetical protein VHZ54_19195 [Solirubrobacterales bacterium]|jgi:hypothetical protein|nr:hypothetical protein [Solirubrobacterales bacterium]